MVCHLLHRSAPGGINGAAHPHLRGNPFYWEYKGQPVDPLKVDPPSAAPIAAEKIADYLPVMELMKARIDAIALPAGALL